MSVKKQAVPFEETLFFINFIGEYVQIMTSMNTKVTIEAEDGIMINEAPVTLQGFLLDEDDKFYYLGGSPDNITDAIKKVSVKHVKIVPLRTIQDEILDDLPTPDDKDFN